MLKNNLSKFFELLGASFGTNRVLKIVQDQNAGLRRDLVFNSLKIDRKTLLIFFITIRECRAAVVFDLGFIDGISC